MKNNIIKIFLALLFGLLSLSFLNIAFTFFSLHLPFSGYNLILFTFFTPLLNSENNPINEKENEIEEFEISNIDEVEEVEISVEDDVSVSTISSTFKWEDVEKISEDEIEVIEDMNENERFVGFFTHFLNSVNRKGVFLFVNLESYEISEYKSYAGKDLHKECNKFIYQHLGELAAKFISEDEKIRVYVQNNRLNDGLIKYASNLNIKLLPYNINLNAPQIVKDFKTFYKTQYNTFNSFEENIKNINKRLKNSNIFENVANKDNSGHKKKSYSTFSRSLPFNYNSFIHKRNFHLSSKIYKNNWREYPIANIIFEGDKLKLEVENFKQSLENELQENKIMVQLRARTTQNSIRSLSYLETIGLEDFNLFLESLINRQNRWKELYEKKELKKFYFYYILIDKKHTTKVESPIYKLPPANIIWDDKILSILPSNTKYEEWGDIIKKRSSNIFTLNLIHEGTSYILEIVRDVTNDINIIKISVRLIGGLYNIAEIEDILCNTDPSEDIFYRRYKKIEHHFKDEKIVSKRKLIECEYITPLKKFKKDIDLKIMTIDIETKEIEYSDLERNRQVYLEPVCLCLRVDKKSFSFAIWDYNSVEEMINDFLKTILKSEYNNYRIYAHNLSGFDINFLLKYLIKIEDTEVIPIIRDRNFISITHRFDKVINKKGEIKYNSSLIYLDSLNILPSSLEKLSKIFNVDSENLSKSVFPLKFLNNIDIDFNYEGDLPSIDYFYNISNSDYILYKEKFKNKKWNLKNELIKYCEQDTIALENVLKNFFIYYAEKYKINTLIYPTISSLAFANFRTNYLRENTIPILVEDAYHFIKQSFFGGYCDVIRPSGINIRSYDVNSLYPYTMLKYPMPIGQPSWVGCDVQLNDIFGFVEVEVNAPTHLKCPTLPFRTKKSGSIYPVGNFKGIYFSEELKNLEKYGYKFKVIRGITFSRREIIFDNFIEDLYKIKSTVPSDNPWYLISKLNMNSVFGRFGMSPYLDQSKFIKKDELINYQNNTDIIVKDFLEYEDHILITYSDKFIKCHNNISIAISAAISAYGRIEMTEVIMKYAPNLICVDTDGIKLDTDITYNYVDGKKLGKFKKEDFYQKFSTIAPKLYAGITDNFESIVKAKGLKERNKLSYFSLNYLLKNPDKTIKLEQNKWYRKACNGNIVIDINQEFGVKPTENKREWIYNSYGEIVDSRPFLMDYNEIVNRNIPVIFYLPDPTDLNFYLRNIKKMQFNIMF